MFVQRMVTQRCLTRIETCAWDRLPTKRSAKTKQSIDIDGLFVYCYLEYCYLECCICEAVDCRRVARSPQGLPYQFGIEDNFGN